MSAEVYIRQLRELAPLEVAAAMVGGQVWREFVFKAEQTTGVPWSVIREHIDPYVREHLAAQECPKRRGTHSITRGAA